MLEMKSAVAYILQQIREARDKMRADDEAIVRLKAESEILKVEVATLRTEAVTLKLETATLRAETRALLARLQVAA